MCKSEFSSKCFEKVDLFDENKSLDDLQLIFDSFLSKKALENGKAIEDARTYHRRTEEERFMIEALPAARKVETLSREKDKPLSPNNS